MTVSAPPTRHEGSGKGMFAYGVSAFAGVTLVLLGTFQVLEGLAAIAKDDIYVRGVSYTYEVDLTTWGWVHLAIGAIGIAIGIALVMGTSWGLFGGITIAFISALANFAFIPHYPLWSITIIAVDVLVIWALSTQLEHQRG